MKHAEEEGVEFVWLAAPEAFLGDDAVTAVRAAKVHLGVAGDRPADPAGHRGSSFTVEADLALKALGFDPEDLPSSTPGCR